MTAPPLPSGFSLPQLTPFNRAWFTTGQLAVQECGACARVQHPPEEVCATCGGMQFTSRVLSPTGTIASYTVVHHSVHRALENSVPYTVVLVCLDDSPLLRVVGNLLDGEVPPEIGEPVVAEWTEHVTDDGTVIRLPQWRRRLATETNDRN
jgi:uncharacterized protein